MTRYRERDLRIQQFGTLWDRSYGNHNLIASDSHTHGYKETCEDIVGHRETNNVLQITKQFTHYPRGSGTLYAWWNPTDPLLEAVEYPLTMRPSAPDPRVEFPEYSIADLNQFAWKILANTNPSTPHVSVPTFIGELKDIPSLVKGWGGNLLKKVAQGHLTWRWAVRPMISDIRKMFGFVDAVNRRLNDLYNLRENRTLRRKCHLGKSVVVKSEEYVQAHSFYFGIFGWLRKSYTSEVWGSAKYHLLPGSNIPQLGAAPLNNLAKRLAAGITTHEALATAWELCPWSWAIDWFSNVGDMIAATNNTIGLAWSDICLMRRSRGVIEWRADSSASAPWITLDSVYNCWMERKERHPVFPVIPVPLPYLPVLDWKKWSILASLAVLRR